MGKLWGKYIFIFVFAFVTMSIFMTYVDGDVLWNYGFSYAISRGEIPYVDFNMILPPTYAFLMSIGLLFDSNILIFYLENSLLITFIFYFLFKMYDNKGWLFLLFLIFPIPVVVYPSYNLLLLFLLIVLFYLEENNKNDYLIGFILGLLVLTKQTVGVALLLVGLIFYLRSSIRKVWKRIGGFLIPCFIFLIYLIITKSFFEFFNHCLFGLFDFTGENSKVDSIFFIISLILLGIVIYFIKKDKKSIYNWYLLSFFVIVIPLFDIAHIAYFVFALLLIVLKKDIKFNTKIIKYYLIFTCFYVGMFFFSTTYNGFVYPNHYNNFNFRVLYNANGENVIRDQVIEFINKNKEYSDIVLFSSDAYFYKITCEMDIDHFDLLNYGNHGYDGEKKLLKKINDLPSGTIMIIDTSGTGDKNAPQFMVGVSEYAISLGEEIKSIGGYTIYKKR